MKMTYGIIVVWLGVMLGGCAPLHTVPETSPASTVAVNQERAREYLNTLTIKKNRFLLLNGYTASYVPIANPIFNESTATVTLTPCAQIAHSQWADNVNPATFDLFTRTMERCYASRT